MPSIFSVSHDDTVWLDKSLTLLKPTLLDAADLQTTPPTAPLLPHQCTVNPQNTKYRQWVRTLSHYKMRNGQFIPRSVQLK